MALSRFGEADGQAVAARVLKPDPDDKNVGPNELASYAELRNYGAMVRVNGTLDIVRALLAAGVPVIVETWFIPEPGDEMGHYRVLVGYSDSDRAFTTYDSYNGPGVTIDYDEFDALWRVFNRTYIPVFPLEMSDTVESIIGVASDEGAMYSGALARAYEELSAGEDAYGWFNAGSSFLGLGDTAAASQAYDRARQLGLPWRMLWYQHGPFAAYAAEDRWSDVMALADANLRNAPNLEESHYWRGRALQAQGDTDAAVVAWQKALELNPGYAPAKAALDSLSADRQS
jgi:tetratricopeptide (TPR) repeat protein